MCAALLVCFHGQMELIVPFGETGPCNPQRVFPGGSHPLEMKAATHFPGSAFADRMQYHLPYLLIYSQLHGSERIEQLEPPES